MLALVEGAVDAAYAGVEGRRAEELGKAREVRGQFGKPAEERER